MSEIFFGGPDCPPRLLRDILQQRVDAVPVGGEIHWATYYFRDRALARSLIAASRRGVKVVLHIEGRPRHAPANREVLAMLSNDGLMGGLHIHRPGRLLRKVQPYLHAKIYAFSHPEPAVLVGSFNPSGDVPEDSEIIAELGDQDRGHNMLVEYKDRTLVRGLVRYVQRVHGFADRFRLGRTIRSGATMMWFYPRLHTRVINGHLRRLGGGARIRGAISHLKSGSLATCLAAAARRGASVDLIVHDTERRVPEEAIAALAASGVRIKRYAHPDQLPLHAKFLLIEDASGCTAWFGSFNYNSRSQHRNHELLVRSSDPELCAVIDRRFAQIAAEMSS